MTYRVTVGTSLHLYNGYIRVDYQQWVQPSLWRKPAFVFVCIPRYLQILGHCLRAYWPELVTVDCQLFKATPYVCWASYPACKPSSSVCLVGLNIKAHLLVMDMWNVSSHKWVVLLSLWAGVFLWSRCSSSTNRISCRNTFQ